MGALLPTKEVNIGTDNQTTVHKGNIIIKHIDLEYALGIPNQHICLAGQGFLGLETQISDHGMINREWCAKVISS